MDTGTFVALFSGINVGGRRTVGMADLRQMLDRLGYESVSTYVQSGNAVFRAPGSQAGPIAAAVEKAFEKRFGFHSRVMVRDLAWLRKLVAGNPFGGADDPRTLHAYALERAPGREDIARLAAKNTGTERFHVRDDALYLLTPDGYGRSKFAALLPGTLAVPGTARNWRTVTRLLELAEAADGVGGAA